MISQYGLIGMFLVVAISFTCFVILLPVFLRLLKIIPHKPNKTKNSTYECGMQTIGKTWVQFNFRYYFFALMFVSLDVIVIVLYPWAAQMRSLGIDAFIAVFVIFLILTVGYIYAWKKKVLEWK